MLELEAKELWVYYGAAEALRGISIRLNEKSIVSVIGANGSGKTTLLRTISGLQKVRRGEIFHRGERIDNMPPEKIVGLGIGHCPEGRRLFPNMSVEENLLSGAFLRKGAIKIHEDLEYVYKLFPILGKRVNQRAGTLSGGEQQMAAIGRALMSRPNILLLDEPSAGLSPLLVQEVGEIIVNIHRDGVSVLLVEQNSLLALEITNYAYVLENGALTQEGESSQLLHDPVIKEAYLGSYK